MLSKPKIFSALMLMTMMFIPATVYAQNSEKIVTFDEIQQQNVYVAASEFTLQKGSVNDVVVAAGQVSIDGPIGDNLMVFGGNVLVNSEVKGDVVIAAANVVLNGDVTGDVRIFADKVYVNSAKIGGDLLIFASQSSVSEATKVTGLSQVSAKTIVTNSKDNPRDLVSFPSYKSLINYQWDFAPAMTTIAAVLAVVNFLVGIMFTVGMIIAGYIVLRLFPVTAENALNTMQRRSALSLTVGVFSLIVGPIIGVALIFTVVGIPVFTLLLVLGITGIMFGSIYGHYSIGRMLMKKLKYTRTGRAAPLIVGYVLVSLALWLLNFLPIIGWVFTSAISLGLTSWGLGALIVNKWSRVKLSRRGIQFV